MSYIRQFLLQFKNVYEKRAAAQVRNYRDDQDKNLFLFDGKDGDNNVSRTAQAANDLVSLDDMVFKSTVDVDGNTQIYEDQWGDKIAGETNFRYTFIDSEGNIDEDALLAFGAMASNGEVAKACFLEVMMMSVSLWQGLLQLMELLAAKKTV